MKKERGLVQKHTIVPIACVSVKGGNKCRQFRVHHMPPTPCEMCELSELTANSDDGSVLAVAGPAAGKKVVFGDGH